MITDQQIRAIAFLAAAARPSGARRWNEAGIIAAIEKVRTRSLFEVTVAVMRAANDRNADTPGVIPTAGPHWRAEADDDVPVIERFDPATTCGICGKPEYRCTQIAGDHAFEAAHVAAARKLDKESAAGIVAELRDRIATSQPGEVAPKPRSRGGTDPTPEYQATRTPGSATAEPSSSQEDA